MAVCAELRSRARESHPCVSRATSNIAADPYQESLRSADHYTEARPPEDRGRTAAKTVADSSFVACLPSAPRDDDSEDRHRQSKTSFCAGVGARSQPSSVLSPSTLRGSRTR